MLNILICDDDKNIIGQVTNLLENIKSYENLEFNIETQNSGDFSLDINAVYDIAILDIEMGDISGLQVAENLKKNNPETIVIILTSYFDYLDNAMKISVFRYLSKPIDEKRFCRNFTEAVEHYKNISKNIAIETDDGISRVKTKDILYIENLKYGSTVVTKTATYKTNKKPFEWEKLINQPTCFVFSHKSFLVNLQNVINVDKTEITFQAENELVTVACVSRRHYTQLKNEFMAFVGGSN